MNNQVYIDILHSSISRFSSRPCLHIKRNGNYTTWSYQSFAEDCSKIAHRLASLGFKKGSNAALIGPNTPEWILAFHASILAGGCTVPIDPGCSAEEIESIITTTQSSVVFCSSIYAELFSEMAHRYKYLHHIIILDSVTDTPKLSIHNFIHDEKAYLELFEKSFTPDDPMVIIFTSGTTGTPKGVVLCQKNFSAVCHSATTRMKVHAEDTVCAVLPLHHVFGCAASIVAPLAVGMDIVCVPEVKAPRILEALNDKKITYLPAVPKMLQLFFDNIVIMVHKKGPLAAALFTMLGIISSIAGPLFGCNFRRALFKSVHRGFGGHLRLIISGGASLNRKYWRNFRKLGFTIVEGYGLSETFGPITVCPRDKPRCGSVGTVLPENEIRIADADSNGIGEVLLRGSCIFKGYYENNKLTEDVIDADGWLHTGDLGWLDTDGYLYLSGRRKDLIVLDSGKNVYPDELEEYYGCSPLMDEIAVFGLNRNGRTTVAALIVPERSIRRSKSEKQQREIILNEIERLGKKHPSYRRIGEFALSSVELPRTTTRKLKKNEIISAFNSIQKSAEPSSIIKRKLSVIDSAMMKSDAFKEILDDISSIAPHCTRKTITPKTSLFSELGLDSMDRLELLSAFERRTGTNISDSVFEKMETVGDITQLLIDTRN